MKALCTGGTDIVSKNPDIFSGLSRGQFLSKKGPCATFDNDADGYCRADGVGSVVLKRLEDAQADKDPILAVILGAATNHSAEAVSITHPHAGAQEFLYKKVLTAAAVDPHEVSYVEMHGTGTQGTSYRSSSCPFLNAPRVPAPRTFKVYPKAEMLTPIYQLVMQLKCAQSRMLSLLSIDDGDPIRASFSGL